MPTPGYVEITYTCGHAFEMNAGTRATRYEQRASKRKACTACRERGTCVRCGTVTAVTIGSLPTGEPGGPFCRACWLAVRA